MTITQQALMTADEFFVFANAPENRGRIFELERGVILEMSRPGKRHGLICANVTGILRNYAVARRWGYPCSNDTGVIVSRNPDTVRGPDVLFFADATQADQVEEGYGKTPPLLAVEVLSPNDTYGKVIKRVKDQFRFGTKLVWILDPDAKNVIVHFPGEDKVVEEGEELTGNGVLPDFSCRVAEFFLLPGQTPSTESR